jgi:hypothetical protein
MRSLLGLFVLPATASTTGATASAAGDRPPVGGHVATSPRRLVRSVAVATVLALTVTLVPAGPAQAVEVRTGGTERVLGGLTTQRLDIRLDNGSTVRGNMLKFRDSADLRLRPRLASGTATGLLRMPTMISSEYSRGAVAGVNGGYFVARPSGNPNGLFVDGGRLISTRAVGSPSGAQLNRAVAGIQQNGSIIGSRLNVDLALDAPDAVPPLDDVTVNDLNRAPLSLENSRILLYDTRYGRNVNAPAGSVVLIVDDLPLGSSGRAQTVVRERLAPSVDRSLPVAPGTSMLVGSGTAGDAIRGLRVGDTVGVTATVTAIDGLGSDWDNLRGAIPGAGLMVRNGVVQSGAQMSAEGINHASTRRARTAVARLEDGSTMLVTIDETGGSPGLTLFELGVAMKQLGAVDAVALDGGGSTTMGVGGRVHNRPSDPNRGHSSALFVYAPLPPESRGVDGACPPGGVPSGGFGDIAGNVHAAAIDCLAWWQITQGVTATSYGPGASVSREQMASFLARWLDAVAAQGNGRQLQEDGGNAFTDISATSPHATAISRLTAVGVIQGRTATTFDPAAPVTRGETATLLRRAVEFSTGAALPAGRDTFVDDNGNTHEPAIDQLAAAGVIGGVGGFDFQPGAPVTRAAMASLVMRASDLLVEQGRTSPPAGG